MRLDRERAGPSVERACGAAALPAPRPHAGAIGEPVGRRMPANGLSRSQELHRDSQRRLEPALVIAWSVGRRCHQAMARQAHLKHALQLQC
jgi:hypothetical protein